MIKKFEKKFLWKKLWINYENWSDIKIHNPSGKSSAIKERYLIMGAYITKIQLEVIHTPPEQVVKLLSP